MRWWMLRWCTLAWVLLLGSVGLAEDQASLPSSAALLDDAFKAFAEGQGRWAYTETHTRKSGGGHVIRVDPSKPYSQQFVPVMLNGNTPTEKQVKEWAAIGEKRAREREKQEKTGGSVTPETSQFKLRIFNEQVVPLIDRATVLSESETSVVYEVPLRLAEGPDAEMFDAFQLTVRVNKQRRQFEQATMRQRSTIRVAAGRNSHGLIEVEFGTVDPKYPDVPVKVTSEWTNKPMFGRPVSSHNVVTRTDLKRVTPYDERFGVRIGPMNTLDF